MKIPYGIADFAAIRRSGDFYVDKTPFLEQLEQSYQRNIVFLRPRRMGKSSLLSMMAHYYDLARANQFDELFSGLWVHEHPTAEKNAHVVLHINFGDVRGTDEASVVHGFNEAVRGAVRETLRRYFEYGSEFRQMYEQVHTVADAVDLVRNLSLAATGIQKMLYVIIDEYDTFATGLLANDGKDVYATLTEHTGFVRRFYASLKTGSEMGRIARLFVTGVSPMLLDDLYTGFNISMNITTLPQYHALAGFTHADVERGLDELLRTEPALATDARIGDRAVLMRTLERYFDGYRFSSEARERVFNSDMVLYFFVQMMRSRAYPSVMLDPNARTDYKKFYGFFQASGQPAEERREVLNQVLNEGRVSGQLLETFGRVPPPPSREQFISLLFYTGMLTLSAQPKFGNLVQFEVPNLVIRELQWEHFSSLLKESIGIDVGLSSIITALGAMSVDGTMKPFLTVLQDNVMKVLGLKDLRNFDEKALKMILITSAVLSGLFHVLSEKEFSQGYCDLFWVPRYDNTLAKYSWMLELKYLHASATEEAIEKAFAEADAQLDKYSRDTTLLPLLTKQHALKAATWVFVGAKEIRCRPWPKGSGDEFVLADRKAAKKTTKPVTKKVAKKPAKKSARKH